MAREGDAGEAMRQGDKSEEEGEREGAASRRYVGRGRQRHSRNMWQQVMPQFD